MPKPEMGKGCGRGRGRPRVADKRGRRGPNVEAMRTKGFLAPVRAPALADLRPGRGYTVAQFRQQFGRAGGDVCAQVCLPPPPVCGLCLTGVRWAGVWRRCAPWSRSWRESRGSSATKQSSARQTIASSSMEKWRTQLTHTWTAPTAARTGSSAPPPPHPHTHTSGCGALCRA